MTIPHTTIPALLERYDLFLLDAYGVLVSSSGPLSGAPAFLRAIADSGKKYLIVSNDASRSPTATVARYRRFGLPIDEEQLLTSGMLLADHFAANGLRGARCIVLGTEDAAGYVRGVGGIPVAASDDDATVLVVADDDGYPFLETINQVVSVLYRRLERGQATTLLLPNPDLVFPMPSGAFGITAGAIAAMLEAVLRLRDRQGTHRFVALGKPQPPLYEAALKRFATVDRSRVVMIGDQLGTDVLGARRAGLDAVLVETGIARFADLTSCEAAPTWLLSGLDAAA